MRASGQRRVARPRRGRPPDPAKPRAILRAATRLFLAHGFAGASMDAIARAAGVSKLTLYAHFGDKEGLFQEMVRRRCEAYGQGGSFEDLLALPPRDALRRIARGFLALLLDPEVVRLHNVIVAESVRRPRMAELFFEAGPARVSAALADYLRGADLGGQLAVADPALAAEQLNALVRGMPHFRATLNLRPRPTPAQLDAHVERCVELFLRAYGRSPEALSPQCGSHASRSSRGTRRRRAPGC